MFILRSTRLCSTNRALFQEQLCARPSASKAFAEEREYPVYLHRGKRFAALALAAVALADKPSAFSVPGSGSRDLVAAREAEDLEPSHPEEVARTVAFSAGPDAGRIDEQTLLSNNDTF